MLAGQVTAGAIVSTTLTACVQKEALALASSARQTRVATYVLPHVVFVVVLKTVTTGLGSQASVAEAVAKLHAVPQATDWFIPHARVGGIVSATVTLATALVTLPPAPMTMTS